MLMERVSLETGVVSRDDMASRLLGYELGVWIGQTQVRYATGAIGWVSAQAVDKSQ